MYRFINQFLITCVRKAYPVRIAIKNGKYISGNFCMPKKDAAGVNGIRIPIAIINDVKATTGVVAQLWIKGILRVLIKCTIKVCESNPSTNQPV